MTVLWHVLIHNSATLMIIHVNVDDNVAVDIDGAVDGNDDCDDGGIENIDFVQVLLIQGLPIMGNFLAENLTFPATDLLTAPLYTVESTVYMRCNSIIACIVSMFTVMYALYAV